MTNVEIMKVSPVLTEKQLRLAEIETFLNSLIKVAPVIKMKPGELLGIFEYIKSYENICEKESFNQIFEALDIPVCSSYERVELPAISDVMVKTEMFAVFYHKIWPRYIDEVVKAAKNERSVKFSMSLPKATINLIYEEFDEPLDQFKKEVTELFRVNGIRVCGIDNIDVYTIENE